MKAILPGLLFTFAFAIGADFLVRVETDEVHTPQSVAEAGLQVLLELDGYCLARVSGADIERAGQLFSTQVLDEEPAEGRYVYVSTEPGFDRRRLSACGRALTEDNDGVLLRLADGGVRRLTRMQVEFCGVPTEPLTFSASAELKPRTSPLTDSLIWQLMARASQDSAEAILRRLIAFRTRYAPTESCWSASRWFQTKLTDYGCDTAYFDTFTIPGEGPSVNVVGVKRGRVNPNRVYIACGHIDNTSEIPETYAPGSDDNASGCGLVLEAARMFSGIEFDNTVWFVGFGAEEFGLVGSDTFARECRARGDSIILAINHDMDSYGTAGRDSIRVVGKRSNPPCSTWVEYYMAMADTFTNLKCHREIVDQQSSSDQHSFWRYGYTAIRDRYLDRDPVYHTTGDTIGPFEYVNCGTNNIPMYTEAIKATVATLARLAGAHQVVGLAEAGKSSTTRFNCLPTISRGVFHLSPSSATAEAYNTSGRLVHTAQGSVLDLRHLPDGVYLVRSGSSGTARITLAR